MVNDEIESIESLEQKVKFLEEAVDDLLNGVFDSTELEPLKLQNLKLKYRIDVLQRAVDVEMAKCSSSKIDNRIENVLVKEQNVKIWNGGHATSIQHILKQAASLAINAAYPMLSNPPVVLAWASKPQFGDYQLNSAMPISQQLGKLGYKTNPREVAQTIVDNMQPLSVVDKIEIAGPGFINIHLNYDELICWTSEQFLNGVKVLQQEKVLKIVVDFSSPNIAKEMHVGHLRSTIIGDSLCRFLEWLGHDVLRLNHIGDWGTQFGMLIAHLADKHPDYSNKMPAVGDLQKLYKESKKRFDEDKEFNNRAHNCVVQLQNGDPVIINAWKKICDKSREEFEKIYDRLDIKIIERGESFYQSRMPAVVKELDSAGLLVKDEGRMVLWPDGFDIPLTVVKSDGGYTYATSDLTALKQRLFEEKADWVLYVIDSGQSLHIESVFAAAKKAGWHSSQVNRIAHLGFGVVSGDDKKKLKTRSGETIRLVELLDEGVKRARAKLCEKERDKVLNAEELHKAEVAVAYGCVKYADLSHNRQHDYVFSFDRMLDDRGNTAAYLLYAYTRIRSIARNANISRDQLITYLKDRSVLSLPHENECKVIKCLSKFLDVVEVVLEELYMHPLCDYLYTLCTTFTEFYDTCYCITKSADGSVIDVNFDRLILCESTADVMLVCFKILGINTVEKM